MRCLLLCKDKNFKANHNVIFYVLFLGRDVCYYAKIRILKQITTITLDKRPPERCLLLCKDKNFKANHNHKGAQRSEQIDVCYYAKIRILKQITTAKSARLSSVTMFVTMQR